MRRHLLIAVVLLAVAAAPARAQYAGGYVFSGASGPNGPLIQMGGGFERVFIHGIGASVEGGVATKGDRYSKLTHLTVNGLYHFKTKNERLDPFVVGGWGIVADWDTPIAAIAIGGGVNYWTSPRVGVRVEFKDNVGLVDNGFHMPGLRVGLTLR